jgi:hypothetical protein
MDWPDAECRHIAHPAGNQEDNTDTPNDQRFSIGFLILSKIYSWVPPLLG